MEAPGIVKGFDVVKEHGLNLGAVFWDAILETFGFERSEKTLHRSVVITAGFAAHAGQDVVAFE